MTDNVIKLTPKYIQEAQSALSGMTENKAKDVIMYLAEQFIKEIELGLEGEVEYEDAPFFEVVDKMYEDSEVRGCYMCDTSIDGNEIPFDYPDTTRLCLSCILKVANVLVAFGIHPGSLFRGMPDRKIQPVIYKEAREDLLRPEGESLH